MSDSIWKTGYPKYGHHRFGDAFIQEHHREDGSKFYVVGTCDEPNDRWAYLSDVLAQADKAERLQKAVDLAVEALNEITSTATQTEYGVRGYTACKLIANSTLDIIKQLIKGE